MIGLPAPHKLLAALALAAMGFVCLGMLLAYTLTHSPFGPLTVVLVAVALAIGAARSAEHERRRVEQQRLAAETARWAQFEVGFPADVRGAVRMLCDPTDRTEVFGRLGLGCPELVDGRQDWGIWPTDRGATARLTGLDAESFALVSGVLAAHLGVPAAVLRRTRRRDAALELDLIIR
ncbi:hypothetical protein ACFXHA_43030 [Nocardia sp. NPDC059240]|uniref:hypothetical protein n=1 Tax=Nocardia sp. NPDC059240 TaxID=3346786 RepID=UPI0036CE0D74